MGLPLIIGLGCSRFGSMVRGADRAHAIALVHKALEMGVRDFDTATIYGQGDSERFLGEALEGRQARIITKAGQVFPLSRRLVMPLKGLLKPIVARADAAAAAVAGARAKELPRDWSARTLTRGLEGSLRRLRRAQVDVFLLHSPSPEVLRQGEAVATLAALKRTGKAGAIGVSIDYADAFAAALADPRIEVIQFPSSPAAPMPAHLIQSARDRSIRLVVREILGGATLEVDVAAALDFARNQLVDIALLGTRSAAHLRHAMKRLGQC